MVYCAALQNRNKRRKYSRRQEAGGRRQEAEGRRKIPIPYFLFPAINTSLINFLKVRITRKRSSQKKPQITLN
jgi:hypothetical protein